MAPRLLLALPQSLFDRSSGAAVSMRHLACLLAQQGWRVHLLCTTASETGQCARPLPDEDLAGAQLTQITLPAGAAQDWAARDGGAFLARAEGLLQQFQPQLLLTFGADPSIERLCRSARARGCRVVLALHNLAYLAQRLPAHDAVLLPSRFMAGRYQGRLHGKVGVLPPPIWDADVRLTRHDPVFATFVNPEPAKGATLVARLARRCPQWPFLLVEGRAGVAQFMACAAQAGVGGEALRNVSRVPGGMRLREVLATTRVVLMPSLVEEAAGRVAAEALANGIPALVSDRGGLPEMVEGAGSVLAVDGPDGPDALEAWGQALDALAEDAAWQAAHARALAVAPRWRSRQQGPLYAQWFAEVLRG